MTSRSLISAAPPLASRGTGRNSEAHAYPTDDRRCRSDSAPRRGLHPVSADERCRHFRLSASRTFAALLTIPAALALLVLDVSL